MPGFIEPDQWEGFLDEFSERNQLRPTRLEIVGEIGDRNTFKYPPAQHALERGTLGRRDFVR